MLHTARETQRLLLASFLFTAGQKTTCSQGLEGTWEHPPPLDEAERDGTSEDQVGDQALNEPGEEPHHPALPEPGT